MTLGERLYQLRNEHNLSQEEFAELLQTTRQSVSRWELNQSLPELNKIVFISKLFSVSTDSILKDEISTFSSEPNEFFCAKYCGNSLEVLETECFSLVLCYSPQEKMSMSLYKGFYDKKKLVAICERDLAEKKTEYAYSFMANDTVSIVSNSKLLSDQIDSPYNNNQKNGLIKDEIFFVDHNPRPLPLVSEEGIRNCLLKWRFSDSYYADKERMIFHLCTPKTEYNFTIYVKDTNIYCGAAHNIVFDLGLYGQEQYFRLRNEKDNSPKYCRFTCNFPGIYKKRKIPINNSILREVVSLPEGGYLWGILRYSDDEIVLQGCNHDEYSFRRDEDTVERFKVQ